MTNFGIIDDINPQGIPKLGIDILKNAELKGITQIIFFKHQKFPTKINKKFPKTLSLLSCYKVAVKIRKTAYSSCESILLFSKFWRLFKNFVRDVLFFISK